MVGAPHLVALLQRRPVPDRHHRVLQARPVGVVIVDVAGGDGGDAELPGQRCQSAVARPVPVDQVVLELHEDVLATEPVQPAAQCRIGRLGAALADRGGDLTLPAAGEADQAGAVLGQPVQRQAGLSAARVPGPGVFHLQPAAEAHQPAEVGVPLPGGGEQRQMVAAAALGILRERQLDPRDRPDLLLLAGTCENHRPEEVVVVGERQRLVAERLRLLDQLFRVGGPVEQRVVAVRVKLHVRGPLLRLRRVLPRLRGGEISFSGLVCGQ